MGFPRQEYRSGLPFHSSGDLPDPGIEPGSPALQAYCLSSVLPGNTTHKKLMSSSIQIISYLFSCSPHWQQAFTLAPDTKFKFQYLLVDKKKEELLSNCEFLEKEVITRVATFEGEYILENRAA